MVYVTSLTQLETTFKKIVEGLQSMRMQSWLAFFRPMLSIPLFPLLWHRLEGRSPEAPHVVTSVQLQQEPAENSLSVQGSTAR